MISETMCIFCIQSWNLHNSMWLRPCSMKLVPEWQARQSTSFICNSEAFITRCGYVRVWWNGARMINTPRHVFDMQPWNLHNSMWLRPCSMNPVPEWSAKRGTSFVCSLDTFTARCGYVRARWAGARMISDTRQNETWKVVRLSNQRFFTSNKYKNEYSDYSLYSESNNGLPSF